MPSRDVDPHISIEPGDCALERVDLIFSLVEAVAFARIDFGVDSLARIAEGFRLDCAAYVA
jgi:hypothetical protein